MNFTCAVNAYADLTQQEFRDNFAGFTFQSAQSSSLEVSTSKDSTQADEPKIRLKAIALPKSVDWRPEAVTEVEKQVSLRVFQD